MGISSIFSALSRRLEGKVALITGGAGGIGACTAKQFRRHGAEVIIADIQDELGLSLCEERGYADSFIHCDVSDEDSVRSSIDSVIAKYGKLDIMFNNAAVGPPHRNILETEKAEFERVLAVNVTGVFLGVKHAARVMIPASRGSIINTASVASILGGVSTHAYTSSKHALLGLTKNAAVELGQFGIRVNCVSPYAVLTPIMREGVLKVGPEELQKGIDAAANLKGVSLKAEDIAEAAVYLGSDDSQYVSGHNLVVDGGYSIVNPLFAKMNPVF